MINIDALNDDEKLAALESIHKSIAESKEIQRKKITTNVELIVKALKKIEADLKQRYDETGNLIANLKSGEDGRDGRDGKDGKDGRAGKDGAVGPRGYDGLPGRNGLDGKDGVSITDAHIDFDGSLIIHLSSGRVINVGEVVTADIAEKIKVITNGGGTSQYVLDTLASLQAQISGITSGLSYKGTWNASTNTPTLTSSVGTNGFYYIVSVAGSTNLNGVTDWQVGDWAVFNGTVWQKLDQTNLVTSVAGRTGAVVLTTADIGGLGTIATQAANNVTITGGSITGITDLAIADGGTGASTASGARTNLGLVIGTDVLSPTGSAASLTSFPTFNQNTTGTAANVTGTVAVANGGTGATIAATARTNLGATTVGANVFTLTNPSAITFPRFNADNTVSALDAATFRTAIGAGTSSTTGTVTSVGGTGTVSGISLSGTVTSSGNLTLGGTLDLSAYNAAGAFTTLSASSTVTLSGGTANGVAYLNGSKVVTSGSALTFDGTNLVTTQAVSIGTGTTPGARLDVGGQDGTNIFLRSTGTSSARFRAYVNSAESGVIGFLNGGGQFFEVAGTEQMRLTSTGLGIGTSSPASKLDVVSAGGVYARVQNTASTADAYFFAQNTLGSGFFGINATGPYIYTSSAVPILFYTSGSERMRITSAGNVGIGTTSPISKLANTSTNIGDAAGLTTGTTAIQWITSVQGYVAAFSNTGAGSQFANGLLVETVGTSNDADAIVNFESGGVNRLKLTGAGNLGLGVTPSAWASGTKAFQLQGGSLWSYSTAIVDIIQNGYFNGTNNIYSSTAAASFYRQTAGAHTWFNAPSGTAGTAITFTQAMTLDADGDLGIGTTTPTYKLDVNNASGGLIGRFVNGVGRGNVRLDGYDDTTLQFYRRGASVGFIQTDSSGVEFIAGTAGAYPFIFYTNNTERARIDSSGNLLINTTTSFNNGKLGIVFNGDTQSAIAIQNSATTANTVVFRNSSGTTIGTITNTNTATAYNTSSDYRLKNTISPMTGALAKVAQLKPVTYKWNADGSDGEGFIAHELAEVVPQCVTGEKDAVDEDGNPKYQGIDTSFLVATLTAAIQELKAEFDAYKASHP